MGFAVWGLGFRVKEEREKEVGLKGERKGGGGLGGERKGGGVRV